MVVNKVKGHPNRPLVNIGVVTNEVNVDVYDDWYGVGMYGVVHVGRNEIRDIFQTVCKDIFVDVVIIEV